MQLSNEQKIVSNVFNEFKNGLKSIEKENEAILNDKELSKCCLPTFNFGNFGILYNDDIPEKIKKETINLLENILKKNGSN